MPVNLWEGFYGKNRVPTPDDMTGQYRAAALVRRRARRKIIAKKLALASFKPGQTPGAVTNPKPAGRFAPFQRTYVVQGGEWIATVIQP